VGPSWKAGRDSGGSLCEWGLLPVTGVTGTRESSSDSVSDPSEIRLILTGCLWWVWGIAAGAITDRVSRH
jgi:hypothetical protein